MERGSWKCGRYAFGVVTKARITFPECGFSKVEGMPTNACQHYYLCDGCQTLLPAEASRRLKDCRSFLGRPAFEPESP
jgi:hypothetical protein